MDRPLTPSQVAKCNMSHRTGRSFGLVLLITLFAFFLSAGSLLFLGLTGGVQQLTARLGADIMIVPEGYKANIESVLLKGEPSTFYLPAGAYERIQAEPGIAKITPQLYVATLSAACCSYPVQIIGIDQTTDFLIQPWLPGPFRGRLQDGEAIVGAKIVGEAGETIHFFDQNIQIAGRLEQTGMGFDATVFVNMKTAQMLAHASERMGKNPAASADVISTLMIKVADGVDPAKLATYLSKTYGKEGIFAIFSQRFVNALSASLRTITKVLIGLGGVITSLVFFMLMLSFTTTMKSRQKEWVVLKMMGATRAVLRKIVLGEANRIGLYGGVLGVLLGAFVGMVVGPGLGQQLGMPFHSASWGLLAAILGLAFLFAWLIGVLACLPALRKVFKAETYTAFRAYD